LSRGSANRFGRKLDVASPRFLSAVELIQRATSTDSRIEAVRKLVSQLRVRAAAKGFRKGVTRPPYDPRMFAATLGAKEVNANDLGFDGRLASIDSELIIEYSDEFREKCRARFIVAHEVAHLALLVLQRELLPGKSHRSRRGVAVERLCNDIAVELLAPYEEVAHVYTRVRTRTSTDGRDSTQVIQAISREFRISLEMAAIRFSEVCVRKSGAALFDTRTNSFVWQHSIPGRQSLHDLLSCLSEKRDRPDSSAYRTESYSYQTNIGVRYAGAEWCWLTSDLILIAVRR
jgi:IrrE N-terminal-like domain